MTGLVVPQSIRLLCNIDGSPRAQPKGPARATSRAAEAIPWRRTHWRALIGTIGLDWQFAGSAPIHAGETAN
jgi:hypothetical protein